MGVGLKNKLFVALAFCSISFAEFSSKIFCSKHLASAEKYIDFDTLLILDLDKTLVQLSGQPTERHLMSKVNNLKDQAKHTISITARPPSSFDFSFKQMKGLGILFDNFTLPTYNFDCSGWTHCNFYNGIVSVGKTSKGKALLSFADLAGYKPSKIVFIDDVKENIKSVEDAAKKLGVPYVGLLYTRYSDDHC